MHRRSVLGEAGKAPFIFFQGSTFFLFAFSFSAFFCCFFSFLSTFFFFAIRRSTLMPLCETIQHHGPSAGPRGRAQGAGGAPGGLCPSLPPEQCWGPGRGSARGTTHCCQTVPDAQDYIPVAGLQGYWGCAQGAGCFSYLLLQRLGVHLHVGKIECGGGAEDLHTRDLLCLRTDGEHVLPWGRRCSPSRPSSKCPPIFGAAQSPQECSKPPLPLPPPPWHLGTITFWYSATSL